MMYHNWLVESCEFVSNSHTLDSDPTQPTEFCTSLGRLSYLRTSHTLMGLR